MKWLSLHQQDGSRVVINIEQIVSVWEYTERGTAKTRIVVRGESHTDIYVQEAIEDIVVNFGT
jgi:hypothetical protein